jgi:hypothetical protein
MADHPIEECVKTADDIIKQGNEIYQKFTCDKCESRQTIDVANTFFTHGKCEECGYVTDIEKKGCNYVAIFKVR